MKNPPSALGWNERGWVRMVRPINTAVGGRRTSGCLARHTTRKSETERHQKRTPISSSGESFSGEPEEEFPAALLLRGIGQYLV